MAANGWMTSKSDKVYRLKFVNRLSEVDDKFMNIKCVWYNNKYILFLHVYCNVCCFPLNSKWPPKISYGDSLYVSEEKINNIKLHNFCYKTLLKMFPVKELNASCFFFFFFFFFLRFCWCWPGFFHDEKSFKLWCLHCEIVRIMMIIYDINVLWHLMWARLKK